MEDTQMSKLKLFAAVIIIGFLGLQSIAMPKGIKTL